MSALLDYARAVVNDIQYRLFGPRHSVPEPIEPFTVKKARIFFTNGVGTPIVGVTSWVADELVPNDIKGAIAEGFRRVEISTVYHNERLIGEGIAKAIKEKLVKRKELFVVLKVWLHEIDNNDIRKKVVDTLKEMKLKKVDLLQAHISATYNAVSAELAKKIWLQMHQIYKSGLTKSLGVVNWRTDQIRRVMNLFLTPVHNSQRELDICYVDLDHWEFCEDYNITFTKYGTLGNPNRLNYTVTSTHDMDWAVRSMETGTEIIRDIAKSHEATAPKVMLRYAIHNGFVSRPSINMIYLPEQYQTFFRLSQEELLALENGQVSHKLRVWNITTGYTEDLPPAPSTPKMERRAKL